MKSLYLFIMLGIPGIMLLNSCVSMKKYKELTALNQGNETAKQQCYTDLNRLQSDYADLRKDKDSITNAGSAALNAKQHELDLKEKELKDREQRIQQLNAMLDQKNRVVKNLKDKVANALVGYAADDLTVELRDGKVYVSLSEKLLFPSGSDKVNKTGTEAIQKLATALANSDTTITIYIEGHTDTVPIKTARFYDNWDLSVSRATSIIRILTANGVNPDQVIASGRGEYFPVADNSTEEGRQKNRRTEIILSPKLDELFNVLSTN